MSDKTVLVVGMGEVGQPLAQILSRTYRCSTVDISPVELTDPVSVMHICYPFQIPGFAEVTAAYVEKYRPELVIINSTVAPGTTRKVQGRVRQPVAYSPVRGKHAKMESDMLHYKKFVAGFTPEATHDAEDHFAKAGFSTSTFRNPEIAELAKLVETTWLGVLISWAQEIERLAAQHGGSYDDVNSFIQEIDFLPTDVFPGHIGGHCVMPNIEILLRDHDSSFLREIVESNQIKEHALKAAARGKTN